jgi:hypothetical protein
VDSRVIISVTASLNILTEVLNAFKGAIEGLIMIFLRYSTVEIAVDLLPSRTGNIFVIYIYRSTPKVLSPIVFNSWFNMNSYMD